MHFYAEVNGKIEPKHFVPMSKDPSKTRPSRTTDAKKAAKTGEIWYPSVTGVLNILDKPALVNWKVDKHLEQAYLPYEGEVLSFDDWKRMIKAKTQEELDKAPKAGTDIHKILEDNLCVDNRERDTHLSEMENAIIDRVGNTLMDKGIDVTQKDLEGYFICKEYGYAGCADLANQDWVIDYKSKQEAAKFKPGKMAYPEHCRQLASYGRALCGDSFRAANIFICLETGEIDFHEHSKEDLHNSWLDFLDCLSIYSRNTYKAGINK